MFLMAGVFVLSLTSLFMATFVLVRNSGVGVNRSFALFGYLVALWMPANYIGANFKNYTYAKYFIQTDFLVGTFAIFSFWLLTRSFYLMAKPENRKTQRYITWGLLSLTFIAALATLSPHIVTVETIDSHVQIKYGPYYGLFSIASLLSLVLACYNLVFAFKHASGRLKVQMKLMLLGLALLAIFLGFANFVLPMFTTSGSLNLLAGNLSYLGIVVFVSSAFYVIIKHRLFDIRLAIARTIGFLAAIILVAILYSVLAIGLGTLLIAHGQVLFIKDSLQLLLLLPPIVFIALTFHGVQQYFAKVTRHVFYQDIYDTQKILDTLSNTLITESDINKITKHSLTIIDEAIKPSSACFVVCNSEGEIYYKVLINRKDLPPIDSIIKAIKHLKDRALVKDDLSVDRWPYELEVTNISLLLRLGSAKNLIGLLLFGPKQSGRVYTKQDIELLQICSKNLGIAIENARKIDQIAQFAETLSGEVRRATTKLRNANKELRTLDSLKDEFISMASHQLRTPASSVHEAIQMLGEGSLTSSDRKRLVELAEASSERLVNVIVDMLSVAQIQAGQFTIDKSKVNMSELVEKALVETSALAEQKQIKLSFSKPGAPIYVLADRAKINEAISNYIENAIKYSKSGSTITIGLKKKDERISFEVADGGIGVPPHERKNLFTKFYRAKNARFEHPEGSGVGLFVVKTVAQAHGGDTYYKPLEKGSLFGFWIPSHD